MKTILILLAALTITASAQYRTWTQEATGRTIKAKMTDKAEDHSKAKVATINGKVFWLDSADLSQADQEFILNWEPEIDHLAARVIKSGKGSKVIRVTARAQAKELVLTVIHNNGRPDSVIQIVKDAFVERTFTVGVRYDVILRDKETGEIVDTEKWNRKTGL